jgi:hypothetical protein
MRGFTGAIHVRCWQTDAAKRPSAKTLWDVPKGLTVEPDNSRGWTVDWAVRTVLNCQKARATEAE